MHTLGKDDFCHSLAIHTTALINTQSCDNEKLLCKDLKIVRLFTFTMGKVTIIQAEAVSPTIPNIIYSKCNVPNLDSN